MSPADEPPAPDQDPPKQRDRFLLAEDATSQTWLDLETGAQYQTSRPTPRSPSTTVGSDAAGAPLVPIRQIVEGWLADAELQHKWLESGQAVTLPFSLSTCTAIARIEFDEQARWLRCVVDYDLIVPKHRRAPVQEAAMRLMDELLPHAVVVHADQGYAYGYAQTSLLGRECTRGELAQLFVSVMDFAAVVHAVLSAVAAGLIPPVRALDAAMRAWQAHRGELGDEPEPT